MPDDYLKDVQNFLEDKLPELDVVVMPDLFLDRLLNLRCDLRTFARKIKRIREAKGGSIDGIEQVDIRGGNAINTASALARLGVGVTPIVCTSRLGLSVSRQYLGKPKVDYSHFKIRERPSMTTALELGNGQKRVNVMLRDVGALENFGPHDLSGEDFEAIENADYVCMFNWAGTKHFGTELAKTVFNHTKANGKGKTYYDTADPTPNIRGIKRLLKILQSKMVDILSVNENEAVCYAKYLGKRAGKNNKIERLEQSALEASRFLRSKVSARVDLHTTSFSATLTRNSEIVAPAFNVRVLRATGAGDAWNAGNILGDAGGLSEGCRLTLANAIAAYYISSPNGMHPTRKELTAFCRKLKPCVSS